MGPSKKRLKQQMQDVRESLSLQTKIAKMVDRRSFLNLRMKSFTIRYGEETGDQNRVWFKWPWRTYASWRYKSKVAIDGQKLKELAPEYLMPQDEMLNLTELESRITDPILKATIKQIKKKYADLITKSEDCLPDLDRWQADLEEGKIPEKIVNAIQGASLTPTKEQIKNPANYVLTPSKVSSKLYICSCCGNKRPKNLNAPCPDCGHLEE